MPCLASLITLSVNILVLLILSPAYAAVSGEQIRQQVIRHIEQSMPWLPDAARIDVNTPPDLEGLATDGIAIRVETIGSEEYVGDVTFLVRVSDRKQQRQLTIRGRIEIMRDVAVAARLLEKDSILSSADIKMKKKWVRNIDPGLVDSPDRAFGKRIVIGVRAGAEIKTAMLKDPIIIKKGKNVRINLERGPMSVTTMGISEEDGYAGSMIRVRNISSDRIVYAKVTDTDTVRVDF